MFVIIYDEIVMLINNVFYKLFNIHTYNYVMKN